MFFPIKNQFTQKALAGTLFTDLELKATELLLITYDSTIPQPFVNAQLKTLPDVPLPVNVPSWS
jgi:hypothetical protein